MGALKIACPSCPAQVDEQCYRLTRSSLGAERTRVPVKTPHTLRYEARIAQLEAMLNEVGR